MKVKLFVEKLEKNKLNNMKKSKNKIFFQKKKRILKKIFGLFDKPRLSVFKSNKHIYAQLIDDENHQTLCYSSTLKKSLFDNVFFKATKYHSFLVGKDLGQQAKLKKIKSIIFDRGKNLYHGLIKNLADGARYEGLKF